MKLSFVVCTHGAMKTSSSSVEYAVMYAFAWIFVSAPTHRVVLDERAPADDDVVADHAAFPHAEPWSPTITRAPIVPAKTIAPVETIVPGRS